MSKLPLAPRGKSNVQVDFYMVLHSILTLRLISARRTQATNRRHPEDCPVGQGYYETGVAPDLMILAYERDLRVLDRHSLQYASSGEETHRINATCGHCNVAWPCAELVDLGTVYQVWGND